MRMFVDVQYHDNMDDLDADEYRELTAEIAAALIAVAGTDWNPTRAGLAPFKVLARRE